MPSQVMMICLQVLDENDLSLLKIITFLGLKSQVVFLDDSEYALDYLRQQLSKSDYCTVINCNALLKIYARGRIEEFKRFFFTACSSMLIYNISPGNDAPELIRSLSDGKLRSVYQLTSDSQKYTVSNENIHITRQFHGLSFGPINKEYDFTFNTIYDYDDMITLISIDDHPFFVKSRENKCEVFFVANNRIIDIDKKLGDPKRLTAYFSQIIPEVMFLRYIFGDNCWHTARCCANLTIDDPLLRKSYGFLNYRTLLEKMDRYGICTSIAFIPINYRRNDSETTRLFLERPERFSVCIHGSQHTHSEFGIDDPDELNKKISLATRRMDEHQKRTCIPYDKIMIFPRGAFSGNSMRMLKFHNYLAVVNTEALSQDNENMLPFSACLEPAVMCYEGFPLFLRRYPEHIEDFAFDSFFGKPLLFVAHHNYFKQGYGDLEDLIERIRSIDSTIGWDRLGNTIKHSYFMKNRPDGNIDVKMYTNPTIITNTYQKKTTYYIRKAEKDHNAVKKIRFTGGTVLSSQKDSDSITVVAEISPEKSAELSIEYTNNYSVKIQSSIDRDSAGAVIRRYLSEIRDNYVSKSNLLSSIAAAGQKGISRAWGFIQNNTQMND